MANPIPVNENKENRIENEEKKTPIFTIEILKIIKEAQQQHGLRHNDYQRYRGYCSRRIRRLRKVMHLQQGDRRNFRKKNITEANLTDERALYIPLMLAERAWSYAMQLRVEANTEPRKKFHLVSRLRKAATYALQLQKLCESDKFDARTQLETQAYVAWCEGMLHFELQEWKPAIENLKKAQMIYEKLASALNEEDAILYRNKYEELEPSLRYCAYNIGNETDVNQLLHLRNQAQGDLLVTLDALMAQTRDSLSEVNWRNRTVPVKNTRVRTFLLANRDFDGMLDKCSTLAEKNDSLEQHLMDCKDAMHAIRDDLKTEQKLDGASTAVASSLQYLHTYLSFIRLERSIQRNLLLIENALENENKPGSLGSKKLQDITRLYEILIQNIIEQQQLPGLEDDKEFQENLNIKAKAYKAFRCYYIGQSLSTFHRWKDTMAMYERALLHASSILKQVDGDLKMRLGDLINVIESSKYSAHAQSVLEQDNEEQFNSLKNSKLLKLPLAKRLDEYFEDPSILGKDPNVIKLPPEMEEIPCKPMFFDVALNYIKLPTFKKIPAPSNSVNKEGISGFVKGLWGWGGKK
ncbi:signal recognition particle subunit SRP68 [Daktulosphaira vitifoliae]|uniref:signal recognition particle subunit SRP68 n=1 Tax=Daktulosphaira vitifoliae TaxID=58002 RepID=UPI0021AA8403|nr:signal recognition particle subunit SRP68 [Daktulosphaira vitifoliae]